MRYAPTIRGKVHMPEANIGAQCRAARVLLKWTREELSEASGIDVRTIANIELGNTVPRDSTAAKLRRAMEAAGVEFQSGETGAGVRLRPR